MAGKIEAEKRREEPFYVSEWLREGMHGMRHSLRMKRPGPLVPEQFKTHTRAARREMLLAVRSLLDSAIEKMRDEPEVPKVPR
jgi:hypothetical protein